MADRSTHRRLPDYTQGDSWPHGASISPSRFHYRRMMEKQNPNNGRTASAWTAHTGQASSSSNTGIQWAQIDVTGGSVATAPVQQQQYFPDSTLYRWMPSLAVDRAGDMAV